MIRRTFLKTAALGAAATAARGGGRPRPNILVILVDDMGYSDIGCFGGEIETPTLDRLAAGGVRFTQFYNTSRCCPTRASLLTGLYPHQAGIGMMVYRDRGPGYRGNLNDRCVTFGQVLREAGYTTMMVGKWHAGHARRSRPEVRGFDRFTGVYPHIDSYWKVLKGCAVYRDRKLLIPAGENPKNPYRPDAAFYTTDFFTDAALDYIDRAAGASKPFLLHLCYNVPHFPLETPDDLIAKYRGRYLKGWDALRAEKLARMKKMGIVTPAQKLPAVRGFKNRKIAGFGGVGAETDVLPKWEDIPERDRKELDFRRAMYAGQIDRFDWNVGRIVDRLEKHNILDNTLILFFSDNGCSGELGLFGMNWKKYTSANYRAWRKKGGWSISQGQCWACFSNTPFRKYKKFVHEGGIASPFIAHWPAGISNPGRIETAPYFHVMDVMPTLCAAAGATCPAALEGREITPSPGRSMLPQITGGEKEGGGAGDGEPRAICWQHENHAAIRAGRWKLVTVDDRKGDWELYDLSADRGETENLAASRPEIVERLKRTWTAWARDVNALPFPEKRGKPTPNPWPPAGW